MRYRKSTRGRVPSVVLGAITAALGAAGCSTSVECTLIGCIDALFVTVERRDGVPLHSGEYTAVAVTDDVTFTFVCDVGEVQSCVASPRTDGVSASVVLGSSGAERLVLELPVGTVSVTVSVSRDGVPLGEASFTPAYEKHSPNGPGCGRPCTYASETLTLDE